MIRFDKFTQKAQEALQQSQEVASKSDGQVLYPLHLLVALAEEREGIVRPVLEKCGVQPDAIVSEGQRQLQNIPKVSMPPAARLVCFAAAERSAGTRLRRSRPLQG